jgi:hypothetical protein
MIEKIQKFRPLFVNSLLLAIISGLIWSNDRSVSLAYHVINQSVAGELPLTELVENRLFRVAYGLAPVTPLNLMLWSENSASARNVISITTLFYLGLLLIVTMLGGERRIQYLAFILFLTFVTSLLFLGVSDEFALLALNLTFYTFASFAVGIYYQRKTFSPLLVAIILWIMPSIYQVGFLGGLYI